MSKLLLFGWKCPDGHRFDAMSKSDVKEMPCGACNKTARRLISTPRLDPRLGVDPDSFPTMGDRWARNHEKERIRDEKDYEDNGGASWGSSGADVKR